MDLLSYRETPLHRLDPRAKLVATAAFLVAVVSFGKYEISMLLPFTIYPVYLLTSGNLPVNYILKKVLYISPFALMIGIFNPLFDHAVVVTIAGTGISGGWISFLSIMVRFLLTVTSVLALIGCTGFHSICFAMNRLGAPKAFTVQLLFLYRYIFVLAEEAARMVRARNLRSFNGRGRGIRVYGPIVGNLLLRTMDRAQRIHRAMVCRGFDGNIRLLKRYSFGWRETLFLVFWISVFILFRTVNIPQLAGTLIIGILS